MRILVTGGAGFIGSHIVDRLVEAGNEVLVIDNFLTGDRKNLNPKAKLAEADIRNYSGIAPHFTGCEAVFHLAAQARIQPSIQDPIMSNENNITGTLNVLWAAKNAGVKKVIYSGSSSVYGDQATLPLKEDMIPKAKSPYSLQKLTGELYCQLFSQLYSLPTVILRYFNVYGPRQLTEGNYATVIGIFLRQKLSGESMTIVGDGEQRRDYTNVADVANANILAWEKDVAAGEIINIGRGQNYSVNEVAKLIGGRTVHIPARPGEAKETLADNSKARNLLGWEANVSLEQGIAELKTIAGLE